MTRVVVLLLAAGLAVLAGCSSPPPRAERAPREVHAQLVSMIPAATRDRAGWATDIQAAFRALDLPPSTENLCAAVAVIAQESSFTVDPPVPGLARIARAEIDRRAAARHVPRLAVEAALALRDPQGRRWRDRLQAVRSENALSAVFEDFLARVPLGQRLFGRVNPVRTGGPMQVSIAFAERHARRHDYPYAHEGSIRREVFTRRGGLYFGIAHLLAYPNRYARHLYRFADFNAGHHASRNAAFQAAVNAATGAGLALDGDLLPPRRLGRARRGATEAAVQALGAELGFSEAAIRRELARSDGPEFDDSPLFEAVFALAERRTGRAMPRAVLPQIRLQSPKISRRLTTEWFATRVQQRYQRCVNQAFAAERRRPQE